MPDIEKHILKNIAGSEENVKIKIILPALVRLGWNIIEDCYFEQNKADIFVEFDRKPVFIVETKSWDQTFHYGQGLEYAVKLGTPWVVFSSGRVTEVHHALVISRDFLKPRPVLVVTYEQLSSNPDFLNPYLSKEAFQGGFPKLHERCRKLLPADARPSNVAGWNRAFVALREHVDFDQASKHSRTVAHAMTSTELEEAVERLPSPLQAAYRDLMAAIEKHAAASPRLRCSRSGQAFNLEAIDAKREMVGRLKWLGLFSVFPEKRIISKGLANGRLFGLKEDLLRSLSQLRAPNDGAGVAKIVATLSACLEAIKLTPTAREQYKGEDIQDEP